MPAKLSDEKIAAVLADVRASGLGRNAIARKHGVGIATVSKYVEAEGLQDCFDRSRTERATADRMVDLAAKRADLATMLLDDTFRLRDRMWGTQYQVVVVGVQGGGSKSEVVAVPTDAAGFRNYMTSIGIAIDKVGVLVPPDNPHADAQGLLGALAEELGVDGS